MLSSCTCSDRASPTPWSGAEAALFSASGAGDSDDVLSTVSAVLGSSAPSAFAGGFPFTVCWFGSRRNRH